MLSCKFCETFNNKTKHLRPTLPTPKSPSRPTPLTPFFRPTLPMSKFQPKLPTPKFYGSTLPTLKFDHANHEPTPPTRFSRLDWVWAWAWSWMLETWQVCYITEQSWVFLFNVGLEVYLRIVRQQWTGVDIDWNTTIQKHHKQDFSLLAPTSNYKVIIFWPLISLNVNMNHR